MIVTDREILHQISLEVTEKEIRDRQLLLKLRTATNMAWTGGCGLACIQIGIPLRYGFYYYKGNPQELINPKILYKIGKITENEGCLSIPNKYTAVERAYEIEYLNNGKKKKAKGFRARIIQHEIDHMDGKLNDELTN